MAYDIRCNGTGTDNATFFLRKFSQLFIWNVCLSRQARDTQTRKLTHNHGILCSRHRPLAHIGMESARKTASHVQS